ncbi:MAG: hypothetical protein PHG89_10795 [Gallionella sp.]|nr:hypothetical protein [Gallionella sp.]
MTAPVNTVLPAITGTVGVGNALALSDGTWANVPVSFAYAWLVDGVAVSGATTNAYTVLRADTGKTVAGRVTATNADGSAAASSAAQTVPSTLKVEDGTVVTSADAYASIAYADTYHAERGNTAWAALTGEAKDSAGRKATDYMIQMFRARWKGYRYSGVQVLDWPRTFVYLEPFVHGIVGTYPYLVPDNIVPTEVKNAWCELALKASAGELLADLGQGVVSKAVGPIHITYDRNSQREKKYGAVERLLTPYLNGTSMSADAVRG